MRQITTIGQWTALMAFAFGAQAPALGQGDGPHFPAETFGEIEAYSIAAADFDGDGDIDFVVGDHTPVNIAGWQWARLTVFLNQGPSGFTASETFSNFDGSGFGQPHVTCGDVDGDGHMDIIAASGSAEWGPEPAWVRILLNDGSANFTESGAYEIGTDKPEQPICADFDDDGDLDIAVPLAGFYSDDATGVVILLNDGTGQYAVTQTIDVGLNPFAIVPADYDEDGNLDLAVVCEEPDVWLLAGDGNGAFSPQAPIALDASSLYAMTGGDFNEDGHEDLAVALRPTVGANQRVTLLLGAGDGTFTAGDQLVVPHWTRWLSTGDLNHDAYLDLVVVTEGVDEDQIAVFLGAGDGTFPNKSEYPTGINPNYAALADVSGDGSSDILVGVENLPGAVVAYLNDGQGSLIAPRHYDIAGDERSAALADADGDGDLDALIGADNTGIITMLNDGSGALTSGAVADVGAVPLELRAGDLNGDAAPDLVFIIENDSVQTLLGAGDGTFDTLNTYPRSGNPRGLALADLNGDGLDDFVVGNFAGSSADVYLNQGDGTFGTVDSTINAAATLIEAIDLDDDGDLDLVLGYYSSYSIALNIGDSTFAAPIEYGYTGVEPFDANDFAAADLDADGLTDLIVSGEYYDWDWDEYSYYVTILRNQGDGSLAAIGQYEVLSWSSGALATGDYDGDGDTDICAGDRLSDNKRKRLNILLNAGDATFPTIRGYLGASHDLVSGDLDGNGVDDLVATQPYASYLSVHLNQCGETCIGDLDGDGDTDQADLGALLASYGNDDGGDLDGDGDTDQADLGELLGDYGCGS
jgi:hypothetical protein